MAERARDVIDFNINWTVWLGNRNHAYNVGTVRAHNRSQAFRAARKEHPLPRPIFVEEESFDG